MMHRSIVSVVTGVLLVLPACTSSIITGTGTGGVSAAAAATGSGTGSGSGTVQAAAARPLKGKVIVLDPGHQWGNQFHLKKVNAKVKAGPGLYKACNSTGTQTNSGYPESRFTLSVAKYAKKQLEALGATVYLSRTKESAKLWGPCIDARGKLAGHYDADAMVSIHADGTGSSHKGFFVIRPANTKGWTDDIFSSSKKLAVAVRNGLHAEGLPYADYHPTGYDVRDDLGTLNWSSRPTVLVELGNMRNSSDAAHMKSATWRRDVYAAGITRGLKNYLS